LLHPPSRIVATTSDKEIIMASVSNMGEIDELSAQVEALPDDVASALIERLRGSFRLTLVPGYQAKTILGRPIGCAYPYILHASGAAQTNTAGQFTIDVARLLHCVETGAPMPGGLLSPINTGSDAAVPGAGTVASGMPSTVVTGSGPKPALFTATPEGFINHPPTLNEFYAGWRGSTTDRSGHQRVTIRSFQPDGERLPRAHFNWHVTLEVRTTFNLGG
jgi:hypothetical protein